MTGLVSRTLTRAVLLGLVTAACSPRETDVAKASLPKQAVFSVRSGPQSLSAFTRQDATTHLVSLLTQSSLVRINAATQALEPALATTWATDDGLRYVITLRSGVQFSDGVPLTSADVVFSLQAALDPASSFKDSLTWDNRPLRVRAVDAGTVELIFPKPYGPGLRVLDGVPVVPRHKFEGALSRGEFADVWSVTTDPHEIVGLGPFTLTEYRQGERLVFARNPRYYKRDAAGIQLPRLDGLVLQILPDQDAQILSLEAGNTDGSATEIRASDYAVAKRLADTGRVQLIDLGPTLSADGLWINLKPGAFAGDSRASWLQRDELRQAVSLGVDRQQFIDTVFSGAAVPVWGPVSPANRRWFAEPEGQSADRAAARRHLAAIGLADRDGDGFLDDLGTRHARFTILTQKGQSSLERGAGALRDQLRTLGLEVDLRTLDPLALIQRFVSGAGYDAVYFKLIATDTDPASQMDFWTSGGASHVWNLGGADQALPWEREIDKLMSMQVAARDESERVRLFAEVQRVFAAHLPIVYFAAPHQFVAVSSRVTSLTPAITSPQLLWAADTLDIAPR